MAQTSSGQVSANAQNEFESSVAGRQDGQRNRLCVDYVTKSWRGFEMPTDERLLPPAPLLAAERVPSDGQGTALLQAAQRPSLPQGHLRTCSPSRSRTPMDLVLTCRGRRWIVQALPAVGGVAREDVRSCLQVSGHVWFQICFVWPFICIQSSTREGRMAPSAGAAVESRKRLGQSADYSCIRFPRFPPLLPANPFNPATPPNPDNAPLPVPPGISDCNAPLANRPGVAVAYAASRVSPSRSLPIRETRKSLPVWVLFSPPATATPPMVSLGARQSLAVMPGPTVSRHWPECTDQKRIVRSMETVQTSRDCDPGQ